MNEVKVKQVIRKASLLFMFFCMPVICIACSNNNVQDQPDDVVNQEEVSFQATVVEAEKVLIVSPLEDEPETRSADLIAVGTVDAKLLNEKGEEITLSDFQDGMIVEIIYDGLIRESYPAQIDSSQVQIVER